MRCVCVCVSEKSWNWPCVLCVFILHGCLWKRLWKYLQRVGSPLEQKVSEGLRIARVTQSFWDVFQFFQRHKQGRVYGDTKVLLFFVRDANVSMCQGPIISAYCICVRWVSLRYLLLRFPAVFSCTCLASVSLALPCSLVFPHSLPSPVFLHLTPPAPHHLVSLVCI